MARAKAERPIVMVEDDPEIRDLVAGMLRREGWPVEAVGDAAALDALRKRRRPRLYVLDVMLPGEDGLSICRRLSAEEDAPILMLTARGDDVDRIVGLELGADDYLPKPFHPRELVARIKALLRRTQPKAAPIGESIDVGDLRIDVAARSVRGPSGEIELSGAEFDLFLALAEARGRVLSRDQLLDRVSGRTHAPFDRSIDMLISRLRKKVEHDPDKPRLIKTVRGAGYVLTASSGDDA